MEVRVAKHSREQATALEDQPDTELARRGAAGEREAVALITQRNNRRLYRAAWSILKDEHEAEEVVHTAYVRAFTSMHSFRGRASLSTWLTRICVNEALQRRRAIESWFSRLRENSVAVLDHYRERLMRGSMSMTHPDADLARKQVGQIIERALSRLPEKLRTVFTLREIEDMSIEEVASALAIPAGTVKTRHLRARLKLQEELAPDLRDVLDDTLQFGGSKCSEMTKRVLISLALLSDSEVPLRQASAVPLPNAADDPEAGE